ncbi:MAG: phage portal protein, partial [Actinobacteria bacterium]|nr:phage portal protein [Actinomycetota bacterium]
LVYFIRILCRVCAWRGSTHLGVTVNFIQKATLGVMGGLDTKKIGTQASVVPAGRDGVPLFQPYSVMTAVQRDLKQNPFLYSALNKKANAIATVPFYVEELVDNKWRRVTNHPAENLIENANPYMSGAEIKRFLVYHKELSGSAYWQIVLDKEGGSPVFLQPLFPQYMRIVPSAEDFIERFEYRINGVFDRNFKYSEVFWTKHADPADPYLGLSPLASINGELQTDIAAREWNKISMSHRGATDVAFIMRDVVTEEDYELVRRMVEDRYAGPNNARRPWILGGNSDVRPMSYTAVEMDYINTRKFNREVISAALGVPAPLIGDADNSTYNNLDTLKKEFWQGTLTNFLEDLRQDMTRQILIPFYGDGRRTRTPRIRYMYDLSNVEALQSNELERAQIAFTMANAGFTVGQINEHLEYNFTLQDFQVNPNLAQEVEPTALPDDAEQRASFVIEQMLDKGVSEGTLQEAITAMHEELAKRTGKRADKDYAKYRAYKYGDMQTRLPANELARHIAKQEIGLVS